VSIGRIIFALGAQALLAASPALGAEPVRFEPARADGYGRIQIVFPNTLSAEEISAEATVQNQVLIARFNRAIAGDPSSIVDVLGAEAAMARLDPDGRVLRIALRTPARAHVSQSYNVVALDLLPPEAEDPPDVVSPREQAEREAAARAAAAPPPEPEYDPPLPVEVTRASHDSLDRLTLRWPKEVPFTLEQRDDRVRLMFERDGEPDLAPIRADLPSRLDGVSEAHVDGRLILAFDLAEDAELRARSNGPDTIIDMLGGAADSDPALDAIAALEAAAREMNGEAPREMAQDEVFALDRAVLDAEPREPVLLASSEPEPAPAPAPAADPVPRDGAVAVRGVALGGDLSMTFDWAAPVPAAAFRRGRAIWIVFAAEADLDLAEILRGHRRHVIDADQFTGDGYTAVRIIAPEATLIEARPDADGEDWTFLLSAKIETPPTPVRMSREAGGRGPGRLLAGLAGAGPVLQVPDPDAGDAIAVVPAPPPARGHVAEQSYLELTALPTAHGLAFELLADDIVITPEAERVAIERPRGLALSSPLAGRREASPGPAADGAPVSPAFIDFIGWKGRAPHRQAEAALERRVAAEQGAEAYMSLARFLIGNELIHEALGALDLALSRKPQLEVDAHFLALRGVSRYLAGRYEEAERDLNAPILDRDPAAQLWRAMLLIEGENWEEARRAFEAGREAFYAFAPKWRAFFREGYARTALALNDLATAKAQLELAGAENPPPGLQRRIALTRARLDEARGQTADAADAYDRLARSGDESIEARAILARARMDLESGGATADEAIDRLESLRFRWRGDDVELETIRTLGRLYVEQGDYQRGLSVMRGGLTRFPDSPVSRRISGDMSRIFRRLFLEGEADRLDPVEALALYYEFSELTPIGADGDRMIRRLSERLVAFDLLSKATELLQHQVDNRLREPVARAQVAADLALIYLMDRRPESALRALRGTRMSRLPDALRHERRIIEARALAELGATDNALELLEGDRGLDAARLRADIAWQARDWAEAGARFEEFLGGAPAGESATLTREQESAILRAAVSYALAGDEPALARLRERFGAAMARTRSASAFRAVTGRLETEGLALGEIAEAAADTTDLEAFLDSRRGRLEGEGPGINYDRAAEPQAVAEAG